MSFTPDTIIAAGLSIAENKLPNAGKLADSASNAFVKGLGDSKNYLNANAQKISDLTRFSKIEKSSEAAIQATARGINPNLSRLPACATIPFSIASTFPEVSKADFLGKTPSQLAKCFGVKDVSMIPGANSAVIKELLATNTGAVASFIVAKNNLQGDASTLKDKLAAGTQQIAAVSSVFGQARESSQASLGPINSKTAAAAFGSKTANSASDSLVPITQQLLPTLPFKG